MKTKSGQPFNALISAFVTLFKDSLAICTIFNDITRLKQAEEELNSARRRFDQIIDFLPEATFVIDNDGKVIVWNKAIEKLTGISKGDMIGRGDYEYSLPFYGERRKLLADLLLLPDKDSQAGKYYAYQRRNDVLDGKSYILKAGEKKVVYLWGTASQLLDATGNITGVIESIRDMTDRKQAQDALRQSETRYRTIIEQMEEGYFEIDLDGNFTFVNDAQIKILGYSRDELIGMNNRRYQEEASANDLDQIFRNVYKTGEPIKALDIGIIRKDGTKVFSEISVSLIKDAEGQPIGFRGISRDITDRKRAQEEKRNLMERLHRAEKMETLGQLAGGVAHDLNNVLGILSGYSELLLMELPEGQRARTRAEKILQSTEKGASIIQDLLTLARRGVTTEDVINLNIVVAGFLQTPVFEKLKGQHPRVTFRTDYQDELLNIKCSPVHLEKTVMNLVINAAESISGKGTVTIRTRNRHLDKPIRGHDEIREGDYTILTVSDTGTGIPAEHIEKIFEPFYTKKTMGRSGTGLGLAIVWGTVKDHNGYIDVQTKVGGGTAFTLYFPVTRDEIPAPLKQIPVKQYLGKGEAVLLIDDIAEQKDVATALLTKLGYNVHAVSSGEEAVEYLQGNKADIIVLDMIMAPGIDGLETYQRILEINPKQKAILVSGFSETDMVRKTQQLGAGAYVRKPYMLEKIGMAIRDELNR